MYNLQKTKEASRIIAKLSTDEKNKILEVIADLLNQNSEEILKANQKDMENGEIKGLGSMLDRILLTPERIDGIIEDTQNVITLEDQVGKIIDSKTRPNGMKVSRKRTPIGTILIIYEARPNVTIDATVLAIKSGNTVILKGGSDAINTNRALVKIIHQALNQLNLPTDIVNFIDSSEREIVGELLQAKEYIDVVIPRGGKGLIDFIVKNSHIPVIETGASVVHAFIDKDANLEKALNIIINAKTRRVSVCNALDTMLIHKDIAETFLKNLAKEFHNLIISKSIPALQIRADKQSFQILSQGNYANLQKATQEDFDTEFLDYILATKIVENTEEALNHIYKHSLKHSETIITENPKTAKKFLNEVDSACIYHNVSTAFSDGAQFGLGAEIGISTQKLHTRGPFALEGLTTYKWVIEGDGQVRD